MVGKKATKKKTTKTKTKQLKVYFCPKCRNFNVGFVFGMRNLMGILPKIKCKKCGFSAGMFPLMVVDKDKLDKMNEKVGGKK